jgi:nicotinamidase-related amidase
VGAGIAGPAPDGIALLVIDMINDLAVPEADALAAAAEAASHRIARLREEAERRGTPVIYVNDNFGEWHSDRERIIARGLEEASPGRGVAERLRPRRDDYFVLKPQFSGFYATTLPVLLPRLSARRVILTGIAADICVLFTAADAHMREYDIWVPRDCVGGESVERTDWALEIMRNSMKAETRGTDELDIAGWAASFG